MEQTIRFSEAAERGNGAPSVMAAFRFLFQGSSWLTWTGVLMLVDIAVSLVGLAVDPTIITGAPAWMKPLKFAISTGLFCFTVAFMIGQLSRTRRFGAILGRFMAAALAIEIVLIDMQAARHTTSHFNYTTPFDAAVFGVMGIGIIVILLSTALLLGAALRERFSDRALGWAIRLSLLLALVGMSVGPMMTMPTPEQLAAQQGKSGRMPHMGAHTVGAPDGGAALPLTGWSADHGDLRIAHFIGLHGMQVLLLGWWLALRRWKWRESAQLRLVSAAALSIGAGFGLVLWQALRGLPLLRPDTPVSAGYAGWAVATLLLGFWAGYSARPDNSKFIQFEGK
jgi:hypothetical protein